MKGDKAKPMIPSKEPGEAIFERRIPQPHTLGVYAETPEPPAPVLRCEVFQAGHNRVYFHTGRDKAAAMLWKRVEGKDELVGVLWPEDIEGILKAWRGPMMTECSSCKEVMPAVEMFMAGPGAPVCRKCDARNREAMGGR